MRLKRTKPSGLSIEEYEEYKNMECLRMWRFPWGLWVMSFICFLAGAFLVASLTVLEIIDNFDGGLWQYSIIFAFFFFSCLFFLYAKIEIVSFDKESKNMYKNKWILCFNWKRKIIPLADIKDVNLVLCGSNQKYSSTLYYKISILTRNTKPIKVLETKNRKKVIEKALKVRAFFDIKGKIPLSDMSTD